MEGLSREALEDACAQLFSNVGWRVKKEQIVTLETGSFCPDIVLSDGDRDCGYVEVVTSMEPQALLEKKKDIQVIIDKCKPDLFVLTNGMIFDIFYKGKFVGSQTTPPSVDTIRRNARLKAYYDAFIKLQKGKSDGE